MNGTKGISRTSPPSKIAEKPVALVDDLVALLNETKSRETFAVTLAVLQNLGTDARSAVPAIMRNADRLGLFEGALTGDSKGKEAAADVLDTIAAILGKKITNVPQPPCCVPQPMAPACSTGNALVPPAPLAQTY
jgi:hypothetical protein